MTSLLEATATEPLTELNKAWSKYLATHIKHDATTAAEKAAEAEYLEELGKLGNCSVKFTGLKGYEDAYTEEGTLTRQRGRGFTLCNSRGVELGTFGVNTGTKLSVTRTVTTRFGERRDTKPAPRSCRQAMRNLGRTRDARLAALRAMQAAERKWEALLPMHQLVEITNVESIHSEDAGPFVVQGKIVSRVPYENFSAWIRVKLVDPPMTVEVHLTADSRISRVIPAKIAA